MPAANKAISEQTTVELLLTTAPLFNRVVGSAVVLSDGSVPPSVFTISVTKKMCIQILIFLKETREAHEPLVRQGHQYYLL